MFTFLLVLVLTIAEVVLFTGLIIGVLCAVIHIYDAVIHSGFYKRCMIFIKQRNGEKIKPVVVTIDRGGRMKWKESGQDIDGPQAPKPILDKLKEAERKNSTINGDPAVRWDPSEELKNECRRRGRSC